MDNPVKQFINLEKGKELKYWDSNKVLLASFTPPGRDSKVRFFRKKPEDFLSILHNNNLTEVANESNEFISEFVMQDGRKLEGFDIHKTVGKHLGKIFSRFAIADIREPFEVEPWNQLLIDDAIKYGQAIDDDKEAYLFGRKTGDEILKETKLSLAKILTDTNLIWASRSQMVCHPTSSIYGEIDEIWFDKVENKYYIGDTKTSSSVNKIGYWYQLGVYIEIMKQLNPSIANNISNVAIIQWIKNQNEKVKLRDDFEDKDINGVFINKARRYEYSKWILDNAKWILDNAKELNPLSEKSCFFENSKHRSKEEFKEFIIAEINEAKTFINEIDYEISRFNAKDNPAKPNDDIYWWKWDRNEIELNKPIKIKLNKPIFKNELVKKDLEQEGVLELVRSDINFITKYNITTKDDFVNLINTNEQARQENAVLQSKYDILKKKYEEENK